MYSYYKIGGSNVREDIQLILSFIKEALQGESIKDPKYASLDLAKLDEIATKNSLIPLLLQGLNDLQNNSILEVPTEMQDRWREISLVLAVFEYKKYYKLKLIFEEAEKENVKFVAFKGCVLADLYPKYTLRASSDSDLFVFEKDKEKAIQILERLGYVKNEEESKRNVLVYIDEANHHMIEMHLRLWEDYEGGKIDLLDQIGLTKEESLIKIPVCNLEAITLGYEEHLIYQMFHIIKHFTFQGVGIRYLIDITLYVNRYGVKIDFKDFWKKIDQLGYGGFCEKFFAICIHYLGMTGEILNNRKQWKDEECATLLYDLIDVGICYSDDKAAWQLIGVLEPYFCGEKEIPHSKWERMRILMFPNHEELSERYNYAKKHKILVPIAWCHRCVGYFFKWSKNRKELYNAKERLDMIERRMEIIKSLGLADGGES